MDELSLILLKQTAPCDVVVAWLIYPSVCGQASHFTAMQTNVSYCEDHEQEGPYLYSVRLVTDALNRQSGRNKFMLLVVEY